MNRETGFLIVSFFAVSVLYVLSLSVPLFGDSLGYGCQTKNWIKDNGYTPIASGTGRGEQAMGHPTLFFWLWALLSGLLGNTIWVARLLPAAATFFAVWGMYRAGRLLAGEPAGWISAFALLASPLFLTQAMRPMPESAVVAAVVWSLYHYTRGNHTAAALLSALAVVFREQAIFLAGAYFAAELFETGTKKPMKLLLWLSPALVIAVTGLINLAANGYFFFPTYMGEGAQPADGWFAARLRLFGAHLLSEDFRWLPVTVALAGMIRGKGRDTERRLLPFVLILLFPALFYPPSRLAFVFFTAALLAVYLIRERLVSGRLTSVFVVFPLMIVLFHVFIVVVSPDPALNLFRYVIPAYPVVILGPIAMLFRYYPRRTASAIGVVFVVATAVANRSQHYDYQPDTSLACVGYLRDYREAAAFGVSLGDTVLSSGVNVGYFANPEYGVVGSSVPAKDLLRGETLHEGVSYTMVVSSFLGTQEEVGMAERLLPEGSRFAPLDEPRWERNGHTVEIYRVVPGSQ